VTHYWCHAAWLPDGALLRDVEKLADIPAVLIHGRLDLSSPLDVPWTLAESWDASELVVIDDAGHTGGPAMTTALMAATDRFANTRR
jgi:proline iminopeptidase